MFTCKFHRQGLSYTNFSYSELKAPPTIAPCENISLSVTVANTGAWASLVTLWCAIRFMGQRVSSWLLLFLFP
eukprot:COSAG02_NODE_7495_length_2987_cov_21.752106_3_plen_73_part_00